MLKKGVTIAPPTNVPVGSDALARPSVFDAAPASEPKPLDDASAAAAAAAAAAAGRRAETEPERAAESAAPTAPIETTFDDDGFADFESDEEATKDGTDAKDDDAPMRVVRRFRHEPRRRTTTKTSTPRHALRYPTFLLPIRWSRSRAPTARVSTRRSTRTSPTTKPVSRARSWCRSPPAPGSPTRTSRGCGSSSRRQAPARCGGTTSPSSAVCFLGARRATRFRRRSTERRARASSPTRGRDDDGTERRRRPSERRSDGRSNRDFAHHERGSNRRDVDIVRYRRTPVRRTERRFAPDRGRGGVGARREGRRQDAKRPPHLRLVAASGEPLGRRARRSMGAATVRAGGVVVFESPVQLSTTTAPAPWRVLTARAQALQEAQDVGEVLGGV